MILISCYSYCISLFCVRNLLYLFTEHLLFGLLAFWTSCLWTHLFLEHISCLWTHLILSTSWIVVCVWNIWYWYKSSTKYLFKHLFLKFFRVVSATLGVARGDNAYVQKHWRAFSPQQAGAILEKVFSKFLGYFLFYFPISILPSKMLSNSFFFFF